MFKNISNMVLKYQVFQRGGGTWQMAPKYFNEDKFWDF